MLVPILTKGPSEAYGRWSHLRSMFPLSGAKTDQIVYDNQRYYRIIPTNEPDRCYLPTHPLTWTTISHVVWDGMPPNDTLNVSQQDAMKDWLHWGGQLIIVGGAGPNLAPFRESFLGPYLPADISGAGKQLSADDLRSFAATYPPPAPIAEPEDAIEATQPIQQAFEEAGRRYKNPEPMLVPKDKPLYVAVLDPKPGALRHRLRQEGRLAAAGRRVAGRAGADPDARHRPDRPDAAGLERLRHVHPPRRPHVGPRSGASPSCATPTRAPARAVICRRSTARSARPT